MARLTSKEAEQFCQWIAGVERTRCMVVVLTKGEQREFNHTFKKPFFRGCGQLIRRKIRGPSRCSLCGKHVKRKQYDGLISIHLGEHRLSGRSLNGILRELANTTLHEIAHHRTSPGHGNQWKHKYAALCHKWGFKPERGVGKTS